MLQGVYFNDIHSYKDLGLILINKTIGTPTPKTQIVDVPGADGQIDLTEYLGEVRYTNRPLSFEFEIIKKQEDFVDLFDYILNMLHGKRMKIQLDIDSDFYYVGRVYINEWKSDKKIGKVYVEVDAEPYKYKMYETAYVNVIGETGTAKLNLRNLRKPVSPVFTTTGETKITFENTSYVLSAGYGVLPDFLLKEGENFVTLEAEAGTKVTITYQEGGL